METSFLFPTALVSAVNCTQLAYWDFFLPLQSLCFFLLMWCLLKFLQTQTHVSIFDLILSYFQVLLGIDLQSNQTADVKAATLYRSCMNTGAIEANGLRPLHEFMASMGGQCCQPSEGCVDTQSFVLQST